MVEFTVFKGDKKGKIIKDTTTKDIGPYDVLIKITHSGLCGTDTHYKNANIALGHEGVGVVEDVGKDVKLVIEQVGATNMILVDTASNVYAALKLSVQTERCMVEQISIKVH